MRISNFFSKTKSATPLETLREEHVMARNIVAIFASASRRLKEKKSISLIKLAEIVDAASEVMEMHHKKEMEVFPYLAESHDVDRDDLLDMLATEHKLGLEYLKNILKIIRHDNKGEDEKYGLLPFHIDQYVNLLTDHIKKEEAGFFPLIGEHLTPDEEKRLSAEFQGIEKLFKPKKDKDILAQAKKRYK